MKFRVVGQITISMHTDVEADDAEQAGTIAEGRGVMGLCYHCSRGEPDEEWITSGELDGEIQPLFDIGRPPRKATYEIEELDE